MSSEFPRMTTLKDMAESLNASIDTVKATSVPPSGKLEGINYKINTMKRQTYRC